MLYSCECGVEYSVSPKEIPCDDNSGVICSLRSPNKGKVGRTFFDYERVHISRTDDDHIARESNLSCRPRSLSQYRSSPDTLEHDANAVTKDAI